jgi:hypothetical protein
MSAAPIHDGPETELVSPELALVDPALAARARLRLADPGELPVKIEERAWGLAGGASTETVARPVPRRQTRPRPRPHPHPRPRPRPAASQPAAAPRPAPAPSVDTDEAMRRLVESAVEETTSSSRRRRWELFALVPALIATALLVASTRLEDPQPTGPTPAAVDEPAVVEPSPLTARPPVKSAPPAAATASPNVPAAASRDFVWAPTAGASGYHVELYRGDARVFASDTKRAHVEVPATWKHDGRKQRLVPGEYRWFVWPIVDGKRAATATVQSTLAITGS